MSIFDERGCNPDLDTVVREAVKTAVGRILYEYQTEYNGNMEQCVDRLLLQHSVWFELNMQWSLQVMDRQFAIQRAKDIRTPYIGRDRDEVLSELRHEIIAELSIGKINAIKFIRARIDMGLREAKEYVDRLWEEVQSGFDEDQ